MSEPAGSEWQREGESIVRDLEFGDFLIHGWNNVGLTLATHSEGGLTGNDFEMARRIDGDDG